MTTHTTAGNTQRVAVQSSDSPLSSRTPVSKVLIIIPTYNEAENVPVLLQQVFQHLPQGDVLIVDDNSPDQTGHLAETLRARYPNLYVLHRPGKLGLGTAYIAGFRYAIEHNYDVAFEMDADFSHDPGLLPNFLAAIQHADLVIGSRYMHGGSTPGWPAFRKLISNWGNNFARLLLGMVAQDCTGGYRCYRRELLQHIDFDAICSRGYAFQVELLYRAQQQHARIVEIPITFVDRQRGRSKMSSKIVLEAFIYVVKTFFHKGVSSYRSGN